MQEIIIVVPFHVTLWHPLWTCSFLVNAILSWKETCHFCRGREKQTKAKEEQIKHSFWFCRLNVQEHSTNICYTRDSLPAEKYVWMVSLYSFQNVRLSQFSGKRQNILLFTILGLPISSKERVLVISFSCGTDSNFQFAICCVFFLS